MKRDKMKRIAVLITLTILFSAALVDICLDQIPSTNMSVDPVKEDFISQTRMDAVEFINVTTTLGLTNAKGNHYQWADWNNDGYIDLMSRGTKLFKNNGPPNYDFTDVTGAVGLVGTSTSAIWGDYDNDGDLDLYCCRGKNSNDKLFQNQGPPNYDMQDVTAAAGNPADLDPTTAAGWGDYDRDGDLDLYVVKGEDWNAGNPIYYPDKLYKNNGDGTFTDVTVTAGVDTSSSPIYGRGVQWADFDNDGWQDAYVSNYRLGANYLWLNNRDGTFTEMAMDYGTAGIGRDPQGNIPGGYYGHTIGSAFGDYDNDCNLDLFQANLVHKDPSRGKFCDDSKFYRNDGGPLYHFTDVRDSLGIPFFDYQGTGFDPYDSQTYYKDELFSNIVFGDYDNDGWLDFYLPQVYDFPWTDCFLYRNNGNGTFSDVHDSKDIHSHNGYAGAWADHDNDGDLDLITYGKYPEHTTMITRFYENNGTGGNHWIHINLTGSGVKNNLNGIGARVTLTYGASKQIRDVTAGTGSHATQNSMLLEFGLGTHTGSVDVEVWWPSGKVQTHTTSTLDQRVNISESPDGPLITDLNSTSLVNAGKYDDFQEDEAFRVKSTASGSPATYEWDMDNDGVIDNTGTNVDMDGAFYEPGRYTPRITIWNAARTIGDRQTQIVNIVNVPPVADAYFPAKAFETETFQISANLSSDTPSDKVNLTYQWEYPNGTTTPWASGLTLDDAYVDKGDYEFILRAMDDQGEIDEFSFNVSVVNKPPSAQMKLDNFTFEEDEVIWFTGTGNDTVNDRPELLYSWDFGEGTVTTWYGDPSVNFSFSRMGQYNVTFQVRDEDWGIGNHMVEITILNKAPEITDIDDVITGEEDESILFKATASDTPSDEPFLEYKWDFGDGMASIWSSESTKSHKYTEKGDYIAFLFVRDDDGIEVKRSVGVTITNPAPNAFLPDGDGDLNVLEAQMLDLKGGGTDNPSDVAGLEFMWNFGNGVKTQWSKEADTTYTYNLSGTYEVRLFVRDDDMASSNASFKVIVQNIEPEILDHGYSPTKVSVDQEIELYMVADDTANDISKLNYSWLIDGKDYQGKEIEHVFTTGGTRIIRGMVTDDDGVSDEVTFSISVDNPAPVAFITANRTTIFEGESITFTASATDNPSDLGILVYFWDFGDGKEVLGNAVENHTFDEKDTYLVKVYIQDDERARGMAQVEITVEKAQVGTDDDDDPDGDDSKDNTVMFAAITVIILLIAVAVIVVVFMMTRKKGKKLDGTEEQEPSEEESKEKEETKPDLQNREAIRDDLQPVGLNETGKSKTSQLTEMPKASQLEDEGVRKKGKHGASEMHRSSKGESSEKKKKKGKGKTIISEPAIAIPDGDIAIGISPEEEVEQLDAPGGSGMKALPPAKEGEAPAELDEEDIELDNGAPDDSESPEDIEQEEPEGEDILGSEEGGEVPVEDDI
jgi:PKD repeat protein